MPEAVLEDVSRIDLDRVNVFLLDTDEGPVLVDAGLPGDVDRVRAGVREAGMDPDELAAVLVTHTDLDHVGGLAELVDGTDASIHLSPTARDLLTGERSPPWLSTKGLFQRVTGVMVDPPPEETLSTLADGDTIHGLRALATPGHGLGHLAFAREDGLVFVGDLIRLDEDEPRLSPSVVNYDTERVRESIRDLLDATDAIEVVCAGHGAPLTEDARQALAELV